MLGLAVIAGGQALRPVARDLREESKLIEPYAPSPASAAIVSLGYRELFADLLFFRLIGYYGGENKTPAGVANLVEAVIALDPGYSKYYHWGAQAIVTTLAIGQITDNDQVMRAIRILELGMERFPQNYRMFELAGEIYLFDLKTTDPVQRRAWDTKAAELIETAVRKPNAPARAATLAAELHTKYGQTQRAIDNLNELLLITKDAKAKKELLEKLAKLQERDADEIAAEVDAARRKFDSAWLAERPAVPPSMYVLIGAKRQPGFDLASLATGGRDLVSVEDFERLEPLPD